MFNYPSPYGYMTPYAQQLLQQHQQAQVQQQANQPMRVILISNDEEVKAIPADYNGNPTFFYNKSGNKIFIKQVNPQTMEARIQSFKAEITPDQSIKTQPDELMRYQTILDGINGIYRLLTTPSNISTQSPIMTEPEEKVKKVKNVQ